MFNEVNSAVLLVVADIVTVMIDVGDKERLALTHHLTPLHLLQEHTGIELN